MRISREIDTMDALAIKPIPYLVTTRGYFTAGGPEGGGVAAEHAMPTSIIIILSALVACRVNSSGSELAQTCVSITCDIY